MKTVNSKFIVLGILLQELTFFDNNGEFKGSSLGVRSFSQLNEIFIALINNSVLPSFTNLSNSSDLTSDIYSIQGKSINIIKSEGPRDHN